MHCICIVNNSYLRLVQSQHINIPTDPTHHWDGPHGVQGWEPAAQDGLIRLQGLLNLAVSGHMMLAHVTMLGYSQKKKN
jgi:hypothetical protein